VNEPSNFTLKASGATGPLPVDRARIARALNRAGLTADARAIVVEGLLSLAFVK